MQFENKVTRARKAQRRALGLDQPEEQQRRKKEEPAKLERGDLFAMLWSAFYTIFLPSVAVLVGFVVLIMFLFGLL